MAWQFDNAIFLFGRTVESRLNERTKSGKKKYSTEEALGYSKSDSILMKLERARAEGRAMRREMGLIE